ncbi:hypothetical protein GCM10010465_04390 [Actinomadura fibrosa]
MKEGGHTDPKGGIKDLLYRLPLGTQANDPSEGQQNKEIGGNNRSIGKHIREHAQETCKKNNFITVAAGKFISTGDEIQQ